MGQKIDLILILKRYQMAMMMWKSIKLLLKPCNNLRKRIKNALQNLKLN